MLMINGKDYRLHAESNPLMRAVIVSLFTWRRAEPDDDTDTPMGWWGDTWPTVQNDRIGSRLYLLRRSTLTNETAHQAKEYIVQALNWMTEDGIVQRVHVEVIRSAIDVLTAKVTLMLNNYSLKTITFDNIWSAINAK